MRVFSPVATGGSAIAGASFSGAYVGANNTVPRPAWAPTSTSLRQHGTPVGANHALDNMMMLIARIAHQAMFRVSEYTDGRLRAGDVTVFDSGDHDIASNLTTTTFATPQ